MCSITTHFDQSIGSSLAARMLSIASNSACRVACKDADHIQTLQHIEAFQQQIETCISGCIRHVAAFSYYYSIFDKYTSAKQVPASQPKIYSAETCAPQTSIDAYPMGTSCRLRANSACSHAYLPRACLPCSWGSPLTVPGEAQGACSPLVDAGETSGGRTVIRRLRPAV